MPVRSCPSERRTTRRHLASLARGETSPAFCRGGLSSSACILTFSVWLRNTIRALWLRFPHLTARWSRQNSILRPSDKGSAACYEPEGREFESLRAHHFFRALY